MRQIVGASIKAIAPQAARLLFAASLLAPVSQAQVKVWEETLRLPSSEEGLPDENPPFDLFARSSFNYPYTLRQNIKDRRVPKDWRAVYLENEYLKCSVLPDLGGHVYTCTDKISGQSMFYANPSIKEQLVSYRGAWSAFGIEFNFPVSHNWVSLSPVNFAYSTHPDGSASVTVGNIDRVYGMEWTVELTLRPGVAMLETQSTLLNRDRVRHRFYWWTNAGVQVWDDSKLYYPMQFSASHGFKDVDTWPVNSGGIDLSLIGNHTAGPVSRFVHASREPFMGIYHPHTNTGIVHYADYADLPGKKVWTWGVDPDGLHWRKALSDNDSAYAEVQAGPYRNQETFAFLNPQQVIQFREYWIPVRALGGITRANLNGALFMRRENASDGKTILNVDSNINRKTPRATMSVLYGSKVMAQQTADLDPAKVWTIKLEGLPADRKYTFRMQDSTGAVLLEHTEDKWDWLPEADVKVGPQIQYQAPPADNWTDGNFSESGRDQEQLGEVVKAWHTYKAGLERYPSSYLLLKSAGRLAVNLLRYAEADKYLEEVEARDTTDAEIHYYRGLAQAALGRNQQAQLELEAAARGPQWRAAGALELSELLTRAGDLKEAQRWMDTAQAASPDDERIAEERAIIERLTKDSSAKQAAVFGLQRFPASVILRLERLRYDSKDDSLWQHLAGDADRILTAANTYIRLHDFEDAVEVLSHEYTPVPATETEPGSVLPQHNPLIAYYRGYCREMLGQSAADDYRSALTMEVRFIFPNMPDTEPVLRNAIAKNPEDANAHWLLGALLFARGQEQPALMEWQAARRMNPSIPALDASLGRELLAVGKPQDAEQVLEEGVKTDPMNAAVYQNLDQTLTQLSRPASERAEMLQRFPKPAEMPTQLVFLLARDLADAGEFNQASALFLNRYFERSEGGVDVREVYLEVKLKAANAAAQQGNCNGAAAVLDAAAKPSPEVSFSIENLNDIIDKSAALRALLGSIQRACPISSRRP